jgi:ectoine hydroxylase
MLTASDIARYRSDGYLVLPGLFDPAEAGALRAAYHRDAQIPGEHRITEQDGTQVRAVYASHTRQPEYRALTRSARLLRPARQLLGPSLYLYQLKINAKPAFGGGGWAWHQDYPVWRNADHLPRPDLINVIVFLDEVTEFNGPVTVIPGSQHDPLPRARRSPAPRPARHVDPDDIALSPAALTALVATHGMASPTGPPGTAVFFHPELVHGSAANTSPFPRRIAIATYNRTANLPRQHPPRPDYLVSRDTRPLHPDTATTILALV